MNREIKVITDNELTKQKLTRPISEVPTIEMGKFAGVKRAMDGGKGLDGVTVKGENYFNPFIALMLGGRN